MKVSVIAIGDELLIGQVTDTNSGDIARFLAPYGWELDSVRIVHDSADAITEAIESAFESTDVVLTTGGLGPTKDDITKQVLMALFGGELYRNEEVLENVKRIFHLKGLELNPLTADQALVPTSCTVIQNTVGTAPIMWFERDGGRKVLVSMPGVPAETRKMFPEAVLPRLLSHFGTDVSVAHHTFTLTGISESKLAMELDTFESSLPSSLHLAYLPAHGIIRLRLGGCDADADNLRQNMEAHITALRSMIKPWLLFEGTHTLQEELLRQLESAGKTVATAESCTGGNIARLITSVPGSSAVMLGGVVAYSNSVKENVLGVSPDTLSEHGAVSLPTVREMACGVKRLTGADYAMATSGIAGPGGAVEGKPVGTVCIAVAGPNFCEADVWHFSGAREQVTERATTTAITQLLKKLTECK